MNSTAKKSKKTPKIASVTEKVAPPLPEPATIIPIQPKIEDPQKQVNLELVKTDTHSHPEDKKLEQNLSVALKQHEQLVETDPNAPKRPVLKWENGPSAAKKPEVDHKPDLSRQDNPANYNEKNSQMLSQSPIQSGKQPTIAWNEPGKPASPEQQVGSEIPTKIEASIIKLDPDLQDLAKTDKGNSSIPPLQTTAEISKDGKQVFDLSKVLLTYASQNNPDESKGFLLDSTTAIVILSYFAGILTTVILGGIVYFVDGSSILSLFGENVNYASQTNIVQNKELPTAIVSESSISAKPVIPTLKLIDRSTISLRVLNGSTTKGAAASASAKLKDLGYKIVFSGNATSSAFLYSQIHTKVSDASISAGLIEDLQPEFQSSASADLKEDFPADAEIIIGKE